MPEAHTFISFFTDDKVVHYNTGGSCSLISSFYISRIISKMHLKESVDPLFFCSKFSFSASHLLLISSLIHFSAAHKAAGGECWWTCLPIRPGWSGESEHKYMPTRGGEQRGKCSPASETRWKHLFQSRFCICSVPQ